jgi:hypothetical protein
VAVPVVALITLLAIAAPQMMNPQQAAAQISPDGIRASIVKLYDTQYRTDILLCGIALKI